MATKQGRPCDKYRSSVVEGMSSTNLVNDKCSWSGTFGKEDHPQKTHFGFFVAVLQKFFVFAYLLCYDLPNFYALLQIVIPSYTIVMPCQIGMPCLLTMPQVVPHILNYAYICFLVLYIRIINNNGQDFGFDICSARLEL